MLPLERVPFFAGLADASLEELRRSARCEPFRAGALVLRRGEPGSALYAVAGGGVRVQADQGAGVVRAHLGPGEVFGEMSLVSGLPVSASVLANRDSRLYVVPAETFLRLLDADPALARNLARTLVARARRRIEDAGEARAGCALVGLPRGLRDADELARALARGVEHHAPGSRREAADELGAARAALGRWREDGPVGSWLVLAVAPDALPHLRGELGRGDVVVAVDDGSLDEAGRTDWIAGFGLADHARVRVGAAARRTELGERWSHRLAPDEARAALAAPAWSRAAAPGLDRLARWVTRREVGLALGAGAARGFAHLGVLQVLEEHDVPVDCLTGSSMGGIVALLYGLAGSAAGAIELAERTLGRNEGVRDVSWLPRAAFFRGRRVRRNARAVAEGRGFAELHLPVSVVAADLVRGERVVLDRGPVHVGLVATGAVPGALPPMDHDGRLMVDGALVSRIPLDLLERRRCGWRVAVNVVPSPVAATESARDARALQRDFERIFGFRQVIARSWELLGWWHGAADAGAADVLIEPETARHSGYDFTTLPEMVAAGRRAAEAKLDELRGLLGAGPAG